MNERLRAIGRERALAIEELLTADAEGAAAMLAPYLDDPRFVHDLLEVAFRDLCWSNEERRMVPRRGWIRTRWLLDLAMRTEASLTPEALAWIPAGDREIVAREQHKRWKLLITAGGGSTKKPARAPKRDLDAATLARARDEIAQLADQFAAIVTSLRALGYVFVSKRPITPPAKAALAKLRKRVLLPATVVAFYERFGGVDLRGTIRAWPRSGHVDLASEPCWYTDPLVVLPLSIADDALADDASEMPLVPDPLAKAGFSAGPPFAVRCEAVFDPPLEGDPQHRTFLGYLQQAIAWSGLPGFANIADAPSELIDALRRGR